MKGHWEIDELVENFMLRPEELALLSGSSPTNQLGIAVLMKFFQQEARFPNQPSEVPEEVIFFLAKQLGLDASAFKSYRWNTNSIKNHRRDIRRLYEFRRTSRTDQRKVQRWLYQNVVAHEQNVEQLKELTYERFREMRRVPPTPDQVQTLINSAVSSYERHFYLTIFNRIPQDVRNHLKALLDYPQSSEEDEDNLEKIPFHQLKADPGEPTVVNVKATAIRLEKLRELNLPAGLLSGFTPGFLQTYRQRAAAESISGLKRHLESPTIGYTLLAVFCAIRLQEVTDHLIELFDQAIHSIDVRAERKITRQLVNEIKHVKGKNRILYLLARKMIKEPQGVIEKVLYPIADEQKCEAVIKEYEADGSAFRYSVQTVVRGSYNHHYRQMLPHLLRVLAFRTNNPVFEPILKALEMVRTYADSGETFYPTEVDIPLDGVIEKAWREWVQGQDEGGQLRIQRVNYELCVLQTLREQLRHKQIWVVGADHYRNPDQDLPADFAQRRAFYYKMLQHSEDVEEFIRIIKDLMIKALRQFNDHLPQNPSVKITKRQGKPIKLSPLPRQQAPLNLHLLKKEVEDRWGISSLLDFLKETELRLDLAQHFSGTGVGRRLPPEVFQKRLLLGLYAMGTNAGLTRIARSEAAEERERVGDLEYVQRRYIHKDALRSAITAVVNATLAVRQPDIWGEATTTCASDSKKFASNDHAFLTQWHNRYHGPGIVIYWHVERHSICIFSQLKTCSSSEVAAMIEGVLHHCTQMEVERNYVDSNGQSLIGFAFSYLLGFQLMPRLKEIYSQHLNLPDEEMAEAYPNLRLILRKAIDWNLIREQYDPMMQYTAALRLGTADAEAILKRFRDNSQHPTYQALLELGKAIKTIFLCQYLDSLELRQEIHEGLNVIEHWNSTNTFIFFGKNSELRSRRMEDQERSMLALHLLQSCLVYINTLMLQKILEESAWRSKMMTEDWRGMTPLFFHHVTPYGSFSLNMKRRLHIGAEAGAA